MRFKVWIEACINDIYTGYAKKLINSGYLEVISPYNKKPGFWNPKTRHWISQEEVDQVDAGKIEPRQWQLKAAK